MIVDYTYHSESLLPIFKSIENEYSNASIVNIVDTGSWAKGEANYLSDHDFRVCVYSHDCIIWDLDNTNKDIEEIDKVVIEKRLAHCYSIPLRIITKDQKDTLRQIWSQTNGGNSDFVFLDFRALIFDLAFETARSVFRTHWYTLTSNTIYDFEDRFISLQKLLISKRCFSWFPTIELQVTRFMKRRKLQSLFEYLHKSMDNLNDDLIDRWLVWTLNYLRFAIGTWSLLELGYYVYRRDDVLRFVSSHCIEEGYFKFIKHLYQIKSDPKQKIEFFTRMRNKTDSSIQSIIEYEKMVGQICEWCSQNISVHASIPDNISVNSKSILDLASLWVEIPPLDIQDWIKWSRNNAALVLNSMAQN